jgi:hypothetical protein
MRLWFMEPAIYERNIANIANWRCSSTAIVASTQNPRPQVANGNLANGRLGRRLLNFFEVSGDHCAHMIA